MMIIIIIAVMMMMMMMMLMTMIIILFDMFIRHKLINKLTAQHAQYNEEF